MSLVACNITITVFVLISINLINMLCKNLKIYLQGSNTQSRANRDWHQISYEKKFQFHDDAMQNKKNPWSRIWKKNIFSVGNLKTAEKLV